MKTKLFLILFCLTIGLKGIAQEQATSGNIIIHRVSLGETIVLIAKKYRVTPHDIYELNPDAVNGISTNMALKIPSDKSIQVSDKKRSNNENDNFALLENVNNTKEAENNTEDTHTAITEIKPVNKVAIQPVEKPKTSHTEEVKIKQVTDNEPVEVTKITHEVQPGETLIGLTRKYNTTIKDITGANEHKLRNGLQAGQTLIIPSGTKPSLEMQATGNGGTVHEVVSGETLFGLARKYNTSVDAITSANEKTLRRGLQIGQHIIIPAGNAQDAIAESASIENSVNENSETLSPHSIQHKVESGETLTGLARKYNTTIEAIIEQNSNKLKRGLQAGQTLTIITN